MVEHPAKGLAGTFRRCRAGTRCRVCHLLVHHPEECTALFEVIVGLDEELTAALSQLSRLFADDVSV